VTDIHPTALVDSQAELGSNVTIGPFAIVEAGVQIGDNCRLASHSIIKSGTKLGCGNTVFEAVVLGGVPQHLRAGAKPGNLVIGDHNTMREHVTVHCGLEEGKTTVLGDHNFLMVNTHVGHDCIVGNHTIMANNVMLSGHVTVGDRAYLSGAVGIHQFCRVGQFAMVGGQARVVQDVPPYVTVDGDSTKIVGLNSIGLRRNGFSRTEIQQLKAAYRVIYRSGLTWNEVLEQLEADFMEGPVAEFYAFMCKGNRGFVQERRTPEKATVKLHLPEETDRSTEEGDAAAA